MQLFAGISAEAIHQMNINCTENHTEKQITQLLTDYCERKNKNKNIKVTTDTWQLTNYPVKKICINLHYLLQKKKAFAEESYKNRSAIREQYARKIL